MSRPDIHLGKKIIYCENPMDANLFGICKEEADKTISYIDFFDNVEKAIAVCNMRNEFLGEGATERNFILYLNTPFILKGGVLVFSQMVLKGENEDDLCYVKAQPIIKGLCAPFELCYTTNMGLDFLREIQKSIDADPETNLEFRISYEKIR